MTPDQIREVVKMTLDELTTRKLIKDDYQSVLRAVEIRLKTYFTGTDKGVRYALNMLADDEYIDLIYLHYRDELTLEAIAEVMGVEVRTILRNKKRLIYKIYELLEEG
jgi:DNA-directed RNA polymerase specialized sigma24 family protein